MGGRLFWVTFLPSAPVVLYQRFFSKRIGACLLCAVQALFYFLKTYNSSKMEGRNKKKPAGHIRQVDKP
jgi:hypothetical protein